MGRGGRARQRASKPSARQHSAKQLAHSPQRPRRVLSSFAASLNRGKRVVPPHAAHEYSSTRDAPKARSEGDGWPMPACAVSAPQPEHLGLSTCGPGGGGGELRRGASARRRAMESGGRERQVMRNAPTGRTRV